MTGAQAQWLLVPLVSVPCPNTSFCGMSLKSSLRVAQALSLMKCTPDPESLPLTQMDPKPREEEEGHGAQDQEVVVSLCRKSAGVRGWGAPILPSTKDLTWNVHQEGGKMGALVPHHLQPHPLPPGPDFLLAHRLSPLVCVISSEGHLQWSERQSLTH